MSTRQERMQRHQLAQAARERLKSGQSQQQDAGPYQSTRARALASYVPPTPDHVEPVLQPVIPGNVKSGPLQPMTSHTDYKNLAKEVEAQEYLTNEKKKVDESNAPGFIKAYANWMDNALVNNPVGRFVNRVSNAGAHALGIDTEAANAVPVTSTGSKLVDKAADIGGMVAGYTVNPAQLEQSLFQGGYNIANAGLTTRLGQKLLGSTQSGASRLANMANPILNRAGINLGSSLTNKASERFLTGAVANGIQNTAFTMDRGETSGKDIAQAAGMGAAFGGAGDVALGGLGSAISKSLGILRTRRANISPELDTTVADAFERVSTGPLRLATNEQYINKVMGDIKSTVYERMTPPLESRKELAKWLQPHLGNESLNEIRKLPYEDMRQLAEEVRGHLSMYDVAVKAAKEKGYDLGELLNNKTPDLAKTAERLRLGGVAGAIDAPKNVRIATQPEFPRARPIQTGPSEPLPVAKADQLATEVPVDAPKGILARQRVVQPSRPVIQQHEVGSDELKFAGTVRQSDKTTPELSRVLADNPLTGGRTSDVLNRENATKLIERHGVEGMSAKLLAKKTNLSPAEVTAAQMLAKHYSNIGGDDNLSKAIEIISKTAREGRQMGQAIQALSQWNKLDQTGALLLAERQLNHGVADTADWQKLTTAQAKPVTKAAEKIEYIDEARELVEKVVKMVADKPKNVPFTPEEAALVKKFADSVKQVDEKVAPLVRKQRVERERVIREVSDIKPKDRTRDQVVNFLDAKAAKARERLAKSRNIGALPQVNNPVIDYAIIGASHFAKGIVKLSDWSEAMVRDLGDEVNPYLKEAYKRATNMFRKENGLPTQSELDRVVWNAIKENKLDKETGDSLKAMAKEIGFYLDDNLKREAVQDLQLAMKGLGTSTLGNKLSAVQTSAQLLNFLTFSRNVIGNVGLIATEKMAKMIAVPIDWSLSKLTKERTIMFFPKNQEKMWRNFVEGTSSGWKGVSPTGTLASYDIHPNTFGDKNPLKYLTKTTGASLQGMDFASYRLAYGDVLATYAEQAGKAQGLSKQEIKAQMPQLIKDLDERIYDLADRAGLYATYQDDTLLAMAAQGVKSGLNKLTDAPAAALVKKGMLPKKWSIEGFGLGDLVLKYARTPANLVMRGIDYSPLGFIKGIYELAPLVFKPKEFNQFQATRLLSRAITGTMGFTGLGFILADAGILTGAPSSDKDMRSLQEQSGQGAYKVNWSALSRWMLSGFSRDAAKFQKGDRMTDYAWMQPLAISVGMGVNANQMLKNQKPGDDKRVYDLAFESLVGGLRTVLENPMVTGLSNIVDATTDLIKRQDGTKFGNIVKGAPASFVPSLLGQARTATDNTQRETFDDNLLKEMLKIVQNKVPIWSKSLPPSYNSLGAPRERIQGGEANTLGQYLNAFLNPAKATKFDVTPEAKLVLDVLQDSGDSGILPRVGAKYIMVDDPITKKQKKVDLTSKQFSDMQKSMGEQTIAELKKYTLYLSTPERDPEKKAKKIKDILTKVGQKARNQIRVELGFKKKKEN